MQGPAPQKERVTRLFVAADIWMFGEIIGTSACFYIFLEEVQAKQSGW